MRSRKLPATLAALTLVGVGAYLLWPRPLEPSRVTRENFSRIKEGMNRSDVVALLGPPGDYRTFPTSLRPEQGVGLVPVFESLCEEEWETDEIKITVCYSRDHKYRFATPPGGAVFEKSLDGATRVEQSPLEYLLWRAKRQWRKWFP